MSWSCFCFFSGRVTFLVKVMAFPKMIMETFSQTILASNMAVSTKRILGSGDGRVFCLRDCFYARLMFKKCSFSARFD